MQRVLQAKCTGVCLMLRIDPDYQLIFLSGMLSAMRLHNWFDTCQYVSRPPYTRERLYSRFNWTTGEAYRV